MPVIESLAQEFRGRARFVLLDADENGEILKRFDAGSFPSYLVFKDGVEVDRLTLNFSALLLERRLRAMIDDALAPSS